MTAIKINPARLPYRGEPTRDRKPSIMLPEDAVIVRVTGNTLRKAHDKWLDKHLVHVKRGLEKQCKNHRYANMWTDEIDAKLMSLYWENVTYEEIAEVIGRTPDAVRTRANKIRRAQGMRPRKAKMNYTPWQESEDKILIKMWNTGWKAEDIAKALPGRTVGAIYMRSVYLRESLRIPMEQRKRRA